jgi:hypothetical protein
LKVVEPMELRLKGPSDTRSKEAMLVHKSTMVEFLKQEYMGAKRRCCARGGLLAKERINMMPTCVPRKQSSVYKGMTHHC